MPPYSYFDFKCSDWAKENMVPLKDPIGNIIDKIIEDVRHVTDIGGQPVASVKVEEKEKEMNNNINWKVNNVTLNRHCSPYERDHIDVELEGTIDGQNIACIDPVRLSNALQEKLNKPDTERKDGLDAMADIHRMYIAGGRQNGKTLTQFKMYAKMLGIPLNEKPPEIKKVIFNNPATIVIWADETKTVVKAQNNELFDPEKGLAMAITKKALGNEGNYFDTIKKYTSEYNSESLKYAKIGGTIADGFAKAIENLRNLNKHLTEAQKEKQEHDAKWMAYQRLQNVLGDRKATKADLISAIEEASGYLGEGLDA